MIRENAGSAITGKPKQQQLHPTIVSNEEAARVMSERKDLLETKRLMLVSNNPKIRGVAKVLEELNAEPLHYARVAEHLRLI